VDSAAPKALTPVVSYSVIGDAAQHVHEHSSACLIAVNRPGILRKRDTQASVAIRLAYSISDQQINAHPNYSMSREHGDE
jgi:hypothetical protein